MSELRDLEQQLLRSEAFAQNIVDDMYGYCDPYEENEFEVYTVQMEEVVGLLNEAATIVGELRTEGEGHNTPNTVAPF